MQSTQSPARFYRTWHKSCLLCLIKAWTLGICQSSTALVTAVVGRMQQNELIQSLPSWECGSSAAIIPNTSEEGGSLVLPGCTRAAVYLPEPFLDIFALQKRWTARSLAFYTLFLIFGLIILKCSPNFPGMILSRAWRLRCTEGARTSFSEERGWRDRERSGSSYSEAVAIYCK